MTKNGNRDLRTLIIHGARSVMHWAHKRNDALGMWLKRLIERRGKMKITVALANKMTRIVWRLRGLRTNGTKTYVKAVIHCLN